MPTWTKDQEKAINEFGGKIIVSAAAGSGKTAVLSQRVIKHIASGISISELLIVTFTNMAAGEMKQRIKKNILKEYQKNPNNTFLKDQISLTDVSDITTMDAFYNKLVKENFEKLGIKKDYGILSNEEELVLKERVVKDVMEGGFNNVENYLDLLYNFSSYNVSLIKNTIFKVSNFLNTLPFKDEFIKKMISYYEDDNDFYKKCLINQIKDKMRSYLLAYDNITDALSSDDLFSKVYENALKEKNMISNFLLIDNFDDLSSNIRSFSFDTLRTPKGAKDDPIIISYKMIRDDLKGYVKKDLNELCFINEEVYNKEKKRMHGLTKALTYVVKAFDDALINEKRKINKYSFSDIAHFVIELLIKDGEKTPLAINLSKRYKEILIDEYQDTNNLQNVIFSAISNDNKNLFIVGDVKQSIYKFRSAAPEIFNNDKNSAFKDKFPKLITLSKNFRSRKEVLDFCNFIFSNTMSNSFGEVNYDADEMLYLGASFNNKNDLDEEVYLIDGNKKDTDEEDDLTKTQKEAILVANKVKEMLDSGYMIYDNKKNIDRKITENDIVILLRSLKNSNVFKDALVKRGISVYMDSSLEYFDNYEVKLVINLLKVIDDPYDDGALLSVLNASFTSFSLDYIADLKASYNDKYLYDKLVRKNDDLSHSFINKLSELKEYSLNNSIASTLSMVYKAFDVINVLSALNDGNKRKKNLVQMVNHAVNFEKDDKKSFHEFVCYLNDVILNKASLEGVNPLSSSNNVLITTIHKSKGLEYPVVILSETGKNFNFKDLKEEVLISDDAGLCFNLKDLDYNLKYETIPVMVFKENEMSKMLSEELRILYVALTRAKEKIIITGFSNNLGNLVLKAASKMGDDDLVSNLYLKKARNYLDILMPCLLRYNKNHDLRSYSALSPKTFASEAKMKVNIVDASSIDEKEFLEKEKVKKDIFDYDWYKTLQKYHYDYAPIPKYVSVSDIKNDKHFLRTPSFMTDGIKGSYVGTLYHKILELLPVKKYTVKTLNDYLNNLIFVGKISKEDLKLIKKEKIFSYLTSPLYDEVINADKVYKEYQVNFKIPSSYYDKTLKSGNILTSGVIDLLFLSSNCYYIVDYKTDDVEDINELVNRYKVQLDLYEIAIKEKFNAKSIRKFIYSIKLNKFIEL